MCFGTETFEFGILQGIQNVFGCSFMDWLMTFLSAIGNAGIIWIVCGVALVFSKKYRNSGIMLLIGLLLCLLVGNLLLKNVIGRPRPCWIENVEMLISVPSDFSFPSGHTYSSFVAAFVMFDANRRFGVIALMVAILIAFSRMYLFVHFPTDIVGGIVLAFLIYAGMKLILKLKSRKVNM